MGRREEIVESVLLVVAESGLKGLTHRAVDRRAGLAEGSTGNLFPRRADLISAVLKHMEELDISAFNRANAAEVSSPDELAELLTRGIERMLSADVSALTRARFAMMPAYPEETGAFHGRFRRILEKLMERSAVDDIARRSRSVMAYYDGFLFHSLYVDPRPVDLAAVTRTLRVLLTA